jgi:hypothetical protein
MLMVVTRRQESPICRQRLHFVVVIFATLSSWIHEELGVDAKKNVWVNAVTAITFDLGGVEIESIKIIDQGFQSAFIDVLVLVLDTLTKLSRL